MDSMRDVLKRSLGRSLSSLSALDRISAAWPVAAGTTLSRRGLIVGFEDGVIQVEVQDPAWLDQLSSMQEMFLREISRIAEVQVLGIHFVLKSSGKKGLQ